MNRVRAGTVARRTWWFRPRNPDDGPHPVAIVALAGLAGSIPFSNLAARVRAGVDLRDVGTGTVSGTALFDVAGFGPPVRRGQGGDRPDFGRP